MRNTIDINSNDNTLFVTGKCNNRCLMCCQPPTKNNDIDFFFEQNLTLLKNAPKNLPMIGISGGEPTLAGERFFELVAAIRKYLPNTTIHILSNGRIFANGNYAEKLKEIGGNNLLLGVPIHSDSSFIHDKIAGAKNAFNETIIGLYNLAALDISIELRIVINKLNYNRLMPLSDYIFKNLSFINYVSFMAMEQIGFAVKNSKQIWIEPKDYADNLKEAVLNINSWNIDVSIFNLPLCLLPNELHAFARKSISDWKNKFSDICNECQKKNDCCGLFSTSKRIFEGLSAFNSINK
jgi:His-Xaa-Ser system radical SAM maturase HxsC